MKKVLPLKKQSTNGRQTIGMEAEDLCAELRDARTVVNTAMEAWTKDDETCVGECVGVLGLIVHKLNLIEHEAQAIMDRRKVTS